MEFEKETFDNTFGINLIAPLKLTLILKNKIKDGLVINVSSTSDRFAEEGLAMYCASKAALVFILMLSQLKIKILKS